MIKERKISLVTGGLVAGLAALAGCSDKSKPRIITQYVEPLFGETLDIGTHYALVNDLRQSSENDLLAVNIQTGEIQTLVEAPNHIYRTLPAVHGNRTAINVNDGNQDDVVVLDMGTGRELFNTNSPDIDENMMGSKGRSKGIVLLNVDDRNTGRDTVHRVDLSSQTPQSEELFPDRQHVPGLPSVWTDAYAPQKRIAFVEEGNLVEAHTLDMVTGDTSLLTRIDRNRMPGFSGFGIATDVLVSYFRHSPTQGISLRDVATGNDYFFALPDPQNNFYYHISLAGNGLHTVVAEEDIHSNKVKLLDVHLLNAPAVGPITTHLPIDVSTYTAQGWEPYTWRQSAVDAGNRLVALQGNGRQTNNTISDVLFYDRARGSVDDIIMQRFVTPGIAIDNFDVDIVQYKGKALIEVEVEYDNNNRDQEEKVLYLDGFDVNDPFSAYDRAFIQEISNDGQYAVVKGEKDVSMVSGGQQQQTTQNDLILWDIDSGTSQRIATSLDKYLNGVQFSDNGTQVAYTERDQLWNQDSQAHLSTYNIATGEVRADLYNAPWIYVREFKNDGRLLIHAETRPERDVIVDSVSGEVTTVSLN
jgi:hypothetical protein